MTLTDEVTTTTDDSHDRVMDALREFTAVGERLLAEARHLAAEVIGVTGRGPRFDIVTVAELEVGDRVQFMHDDPPAPWTTLLEVDYEPPAHLGRDVRLTLDVDHIGTFVAGCNLGDAVRRAVA